MSGISWDLAEAEQGRTICLTLVLAFIFVFPTRSAVFLSGFRNCAAIWHEYTSDNIKYLNYKVP